jgi:N-acetylneuraminate synthase
MKIANREIGIGHPCYVIAEIGINHNGSVDLAKKLIDAAALAGCDAVKFQKRTVETVYSREELDKPRESPFGTTTREQKLGLEFQHDQYAEIDAYCKEKKIAWSASPWDTESVNFLEQFNPPFYKIASASLTDPLLLLKIATTQKPVILSTGMSSKQEIDKALGILTAYTDEIALLCCTSTYPTALRDLRLERIWSMKIMYPEFPIGWSNHFPGLWMNLAAVAMGAAILELHITCDRSMYGSDQAASIEPSGLMRIVKELRDFEIARGDGKIGMAESERPVMEKLRRAR